MTICAIACAHNQSLAIELLTQIYEPGSHYVLNSETTRIIDLRPWTIREGQDNLLANGLKKGIANTKTKGYLLGYPIFISQLYSVALKLTILQTLWCLKDLEPEGFGEGGQGTFVYCFLPWRIKNCKTKLPKVTALSCETAVITQTCPGISDICILCSLQTFWFHNYLFLPAVQPGT